MPSVILYINCIKHHDVFSILKIPFSNYFNVYEAANVQEVKNIIQSKKDLFIIIQSNIHKDLSAYLQTLPKDVIYPITLIHGLGETKYFFNYWRKDILNRHIIVGYNQIDCVQDINPKFMALPYYFMEFYKNKDWNRESFCKENGFNPDHKIILYAPTWINKETDSGIIFKELVKLKDRYTILYSPHREGKHFTNKDIHILNKSTHEQLPYADILISDVSSVMLEFTYFKRPIIQLLLDSYSDNPVKNYNYPTRVNEHGYFILGKASLPNNLSQTVLDVIENPNIGMVNVLYTHDKLQFHRNGIQELIDFIISVVETPIVLGK